MLVRSCGCPGDLAEAISVTNVANGVMVADKSNEHLYVLHCAAVADDQGVGGEEHLGTQFEDGNQGYNGYSTTVYHSLKSQSFGANAPASTQKQRGVKGKIHL